MRRQSAARIRLIAGGHYDPLPCFTGAECRWSYEFTRFPMAHVSQCLVCGVTHRCGLQPSKPRPPPKPPSAPPIDYGFPPFWY